MVYSLKWPGTHCKGGWVSPRTGLDDCGKSRAYRDFLFSVLYLYFFVLIVLALAFVLYSKTHTTQTSMSPMRFEPATSARDLPQTLVLDRSATGIGIPSDYRSEIQQYFSFAFNFLLGLGSFEKV
jgi:hypothetical protein